MPTRPPGFPDPRFRSHDRSRPPAPPAGVTRRWRQRYTVALLALVFVGLLLWGWIRGQ